MAFALVLVLPYAMRAAVALAGAAYVTVIAVATVWAHWHRPSDTVAALLVVLAWGGAGGGGDPGAAQPDPSATAYRAHRVDGWPPCR